MPNTFRPVPVTGIGTAQTAVYTVPALTQATAIGWTVANTTNAPIQVSCTLTSGAITANVVRNAPIPVGGALVVVGGEQKIAMGAGDRLNVQSSAANSCDSIVSVLELS